jgi:succinyl-CoA synthetase alpha subunit
LAAINVVKRNFFRDSLQLMRLSEEAKKLPGVDDAVVAMGTETNKRLLQDLRLLGPEGKAAGDGDLILAVRVTAGSNGKDAVERIQKMVISPPLAPEGLRAVTFHSVGSALEHLRDANLAVVSVPGSQAFEPSMELLKRGINVHLFSDHVPRKQEAKLKEFANSKGLLVLGPGAGTSIINGIGLGFANAVRRGGVGIVASAGTGIQEASILLDKIGLGVSHALGVGGSDVSEEIGGLMMKDCLGLLESDKSTKAIMIIAKTPTNRVMEEVMEYVKRRTRKPIVVCFLGLDAPSVSDKRIRYSKTLHSAVWNACVVLGAKSRREFEEKVSTSIEELSATARQLSSSLGPRQKYARGLYSGGTLAHETLLVFRELIGEAFSNTPLSGRYRLEDPGVSKDNSVVDLGDEFFTSGRVHPMIDPTLRRLRILQEAKDPSVAVIMLDIVLGYGSSPDPGGALVGAIEEARQGAGRRGGELVVMAHVCGTEADPQSLNEQSKRLSEAGVVLFASNAQMAVASALVVGGARASTQLKKEWSELLGEN